jgi:hypothetical protein
MKGDLFMPVVRRTSLDRPSESRDDLHVSIYLPVDRAGDQTQQDPIRFKDPSQGPKARLEKKGQRHAARQAWLEPAHQPLDDHESRQSQEPGLVAFLHDGETKTIRVLVPVDSLTVIGSRCHVKPLLPFGDGQATELFIQPSEQQWGIFEPESLPVPLLENGVEPSEDLDDRATSAAVQNDSSVHLLSEDPAPGGGPIAALPGCAATK